MKIMKSPGEALAKLLESLGWEIDPNLLSKSLLLVGLAAVLSLILCLAGLPEFQKSLHSLPREEREDSYQTELMLQKENENFQKIELTVPERQYSEKKIMEWISKGERELETLILGKNLSLSKVEYPLNLITELPGTPVTIQWSTSDSSLIDWDGRLGNTKGKEGSEVRLYAEFSCQNLLVERELQVKVGGNKYENSNFSEVVQNEFSRLNRHGRGKQLKLPEKIGGKRLRWKAGVSYPALPVFLLGLAGAIALPVHAEEKKKQDREQRKKHMLIDYPNILYQLSLLMKAGLNSRKALYRLAGDHRRKMAAKTEAYHPGYDEVLQMCGDMDQGVSEQEAYESFGRRADLPEYRRLATLLSQNLKKGNGEMVLLMEREAAEAFEDRKRRAKILGEEAATKLLMPMILMLLLVLVLLLFPAWTSFAL